MKQFLFSLIILIVVVAGAYYLGRNNAIHAEQVSQYETQVKAYQDSVIVPTLRMSDSLRVEVNRALNEVKETKQIINAQTRQISTLQTSVNAMRSQNTRSVNEVLASTLPPECNKCVNTVKALSVEVDSLHALSSVQNEQIVSQRNVIGVLERSVIWERTSSDSLRGVILDFPDPPKPNILFGVKFPKVPSQYLLLGGAVLGIVLAK